VSAHRWRGVVGWVRNRPVYVTGGLALIALGATFWTYTTADAKIAPDLLVATSPQNVTVRLRFPPEKFHMLLLQEIGRVESVDGSAIHMLDVPPGRIRAFARYYWVASIDAYAPAGRAGASATPVRN
jgi:hypothetical protein